jgi:hypothetical protein
MINTKYFHIFSLYNTKVIMQFINCVHLNRQDSIEHPQTNNMQTIVIELQVSMKDRNIEKR